MASLRRVLAAIFVIAAFAGPAEAACPAGATCGRVTVPLDHGGATPGTLSLAYAKLPAAGARTGTLVLLTGGPGQAAIPFTADFARLFRAQLADHDLVAVDQRGTGASSPTDCVIEREQDVGACAARLGDRRAFLTTAETAKDLEDLRQALGVERLTPVGISYGAAVAAEYARRFPEHTAAIVLDSAAPVDGFDAFGELRAFGMPRVLREVCFPGACHRTVPDPDEALERAVRRFPRHEALLYDLIAVSDIEPGLRAGLPAAIASLAKGDAAPLLHLRAFYSAAGAVSVNVARLLATDCVESRLPWAPDAPLAGREAALATLPGDAFAPFAVATILGASPAPYCAFWPPTPKPQPPPAAPNVPVLVIAGREDLRTPLESARRTAAQYPNAKLLAVPGVGHSVLRNDATGCALAALGAFLHGAPIVPCRRTADELQAAPYAPATVGALRPTKLPGLAGRTFSAVTVTLTGIGYDTLAGARRFPGLRGGHVRVRKGRLELHDVEWIRGVRVSGTVTEKRSTLTVDGPVDGTVRYVGKRVSGTLGGRSF